MNAGFSLRKSANSGPSVAASYEGQGEEITADPKFELAITIDGTPVSLPLKTLSIFESKPADKDAKAAPQGFELEGDDVMIAGYLPADLQVAPGRKFQQLQNATLEVRSSGGDRTFTKLTKIKLPDGKVYKGSGGKVIVQKAFFRRGQYAGVSGTVELVIQPFKLGDTDDPNNKGDQPTGEPITVTGTFAAKAVAYPFEKM